MDIDFWAVFVALSDSFITHVTELQWELSITTQIVNYQLLVIVVKKPETIKYMRKWNDIGKSISMVLEKFN